MSSTPSTSSQDNQAANDWMNIVVSKIQNLRYGSVQITVHDGRVTLVESIEKTRFSADPSARTKAR
jgi:hypothetical protein